MTQEMEDVMKMKKMQGVLMAAGLALMMTAPAFAQVSGNSAQVGTTLTTAAGWLVSTLGPGLFLIGMVLVGISLAMGNEDALRKGYYVVGGGALIFLSSSVVALLKSWTGN
jgi:type IV secretory pathway VirB2 component (pilin)